MLTKVFWIGFVTMGNCLRLWLGMMGEERTTEELAMICITLGRSGGKCSSLGLWSMVKMVCLWLRSESNWSKLLLGDWAPLWLFPSEGVGVKGERKTLEHIKPTWCCTLTLE